MLSEISSKGPGYLVNIQNEVQTKVQQTEYLIHASGLHWVTTKQEIVDFFSGINILNGANGIHFIIGETKNSRNEAFIQLTSSDDYKLATARKIKSMGPTRVKSIFFSFFQHLFSIF